MINIGKNWLWRVKYSYKWVYDLRHTNYLILTTLTSVENLLSEVYFRKLNVVNHIKNTHSKLLKYENVQQNHNVSINVLYVYE